MYGKVCKYEGASVSRLWYFQCYQSYAESEDGMEGSQLECSAPLGQGAPQGFWVFFKAGGRAWDGSS